MAQTKIFNSAAFFPHKNMWLLTFMMSKALIMSNGRVTAPITGLPITAKPMIV